MLLKDKASHYVLTSSPPFKEGRMSIGRPVTSTTRVPVQSCVVLCCVGCCAVVLLRGVWDRISDLVRVRAVRFVAAGRGASGGQRRPVRGSVVSFCVVLFSVPRDYVLLFHTTVQPMLLLHSAQRTVILVGVVLCCSMWYRPQLLQGPLWISWAGFGRPGRQDWGIAPTNIGLTNPLSGSMWWHQPPTPT